jgi:hypothetical protein
MSGFTDSEANAILGWYFRNDAYSRPTSLWLEMSTTTIAADGSAITPPVGNAYARVAIPTTTVYWSAPSLRQVYNLITISFPEATGPWGTLVDGALMSAASGGTAKAWGTLSTPRTINAPMTLIFAPGELIFKLPVG